MMKHNINFLEVFQENLDTNWWNLREECVRLGNGYSTFVSIRNGISEELERGLEINWGGRLHYITVYIPIVDTLSNSIKEYLNSIRNPTPFQLVHSYVNDVEARFRYKNNICSIGVSDVESVEIANTIFELYYLKHLPKVEKYLDDLAHMAKEWEDENCNQ